MKHFPLIAAILFQSVIIGLSYIKGHMDGIKSALSHAAAPAWEPPPCGDKLREGACRMVNGKVPTQ